MQQNLSILVKRCKNLNRRLIEVICRQHLPCRAFGFGITGSLGVVFLAVAFRRGAMVFTATVRLATVCFGGDFLNCLGARIRV